MDLCICWVPLGVRRIHCENCLHMGVENLTQSSSRAVTTEPFLHRTLIFTYGCLCVWVLCLCVSEAPPKARRGLQVSGTRVIYSFEPPCHHVGTWNWTNHCPPPFWNSASHWPWARDLSRTGIIGAHHCTQRLYVCPEGQVRVPRGLCSKHLSSSHSPRTVSWFNL